MRRVNDSTNQNRAENVLAFKAVKKVNAAQHSQEKIKATMICRDRKRPESTERKLSLPEFSPEINKSEKE